MPQPIDPLAVDHELVEQVADLVADVPAGRPVSDLLDAEPDVVLANMRAVNFCLASVFGLIQRRDKR